MKEQTYCDSLYQVRDEIARRLEAAKVELLNPDFFSSSHRSFCGVVKYEETRRESATILTLRGKSTKKAAHAIVYRDDTSGRYELTFYVS